MIEEIQAAVNFLTRLIAKSSSDSSLITQDAIDSFSSKLCQLLQDRYRDHWFPEKPHKGQAFRCIRINENFRKDPTVEKACDECGISYDRLKLPLELTLWVDPQEVTVRFGEHKGSYCIVAKVKDGRQENYIDQINIDELEQKSVERAKQATYDLLNSSRKRRQQHNNRKNGFNMNGYSNGFSDFGQISSACSPSSYYPFYGSGTPFATQYGSSPPQNNAFPKYPISPPQTRSIGNAPYRNNVSKTNGQYNASNSTIGLKVNNNYARGLQTAFNSATFSAPFVNSYPQNDRYHWVNKSIVKA
jgi:hypothetical protein